MGEFPPFDSSDSIKIKNGVIRLAHRIVMISSVFCILLVVVLVDAGIDDTTIKPKESNPFEGLPISGAWLIFFSSFAFGMIENWFGMLDP